MANNFHAPGNEPQSMRDLLDVTTEYPDHPELGALRTELQSSRPDNAVINGLIERLHLDPVLGAKITNWWNDPKTQDYISELGAMGL